MEQKTAKVLVAIVAGFLFAYAAWSVVAAILTIAGTEISWLRIADRSGMSIFGAILGAILFIVVGIGLLRRASWSRSVIVIIGWLAILLGLVSLLTLLANYSAAYAAAAVVEVIIGGCLVWLFQFEPTVRALFAAKRV